jgi:hypothetical protein
VWGLQALDVEEGLMKEECRQAGRWDGVTDDYDLVAVIRRRWTQAELHRCRDAGVVVLSSLAESVWVEPS